MKPESILNDDLIYELKQVRVLVTKQWKGDEELLDGELERIHNAICAALKAIEPAPSP